MYLRYVLNAVKASCVEISFFLAITLAHQSLFAAYTESEYQALTTEQEAKLNEIREQEVQQLTIILRRTPSKAERADLLLRLGEVYNEKYRYYFYKENIIWNKKIDDFLKLSLQQQKRAKRPKLDASKSKSYLHKSIRHLEEILNTIHGYRKLDEVYYYLGFNHWELGNKRKSIQYFNGIIRNYKGSRYSSEAHRYVADYDFSQRKFKSSLEHYQIAAKDKNSPTMPRILYGMSWSYYKIGKNKKALDTIIQAIRLSKGANSEEATQRGTALQNDAYDALVLFYSEAGNPKSAQKFFEQEVGEQYSAELLSKLLSIYQRNGRYSEALTTSKQLENVDEGAKAEGSSQRFNILSNALKLAQQKRDPGRELGILNTMIAEFVQKESTEEIQQSIQQSIRNSALQAHKESTQSKRHKAAEQKAIQLYKLYLSTFSAKTSKDDLYEIHYYLADLHSQSSRYREAAAEFRYLLKMASEDSGNDYLQKIKRSCAEGLVFVLDSYFKRSGDKKLSQAETNELLEAIDSFLALYPNDKEGPAFMARAAGLLKDQSSRDKEYNERLGLIIEKFAGSSQALEAAIILVRDAEKKEDWSKVSELVSSYLDNPRLMSIDKKGDLRRQLEGIQEKTKFKLVKDFEKGSNYSEAAHRYEDLAKGSRDREVRLKAFNNAAISYNKAGDQANELRIYSIIAKNFPEYDAAPDRFLSLADEYFFQGNYSAAAEKYEEYYYLLESRFSKLSQKQKNSVINAIRNAAFLRDALSNESIAAEDIKKVVLLANQKQELAKVAAEEFLFERATKYRKEGNSTEAIDSYKKYLSVFGGGRYYVEATFYAGVLYRELREIEKSQSYLSKAAEYFRSSRGKLGRSELMYSANARLLLLEGLENAYYKSPLKLPEEQLKKDIKLKLQRMEQLNKGYLQVVEYGDGKWALEAFYKMSQIYLDFANQLENAPVPSNYNEEDKAKFQAQLRTIAKPVYAKVLETLQTALKQGESLLVADPITAKIYVANTLLNPELGMPLVQELDWGDAKNWIMGVTNEAEDRIALKSNPKNANALVNVGNAHLLRGEEKFARIFYRQALAANSEYVPALNNLAYLEGKNGNLQAAVSGFRTALSHREFEVIPKLNMARVFMACGLWRHAGLAYHQLEVRAPNNNEVKKGLALSYLASGKADKAKKITNGNFPNDLNGKFAEAIWQLATDDKSEAKNSLQSLVKQSEYAKMILEHWRR